MVSAINKMFAHTNVMRTSNIALSSTNTAARIEIAISMCVHSCTSFHPTDFRASSTMTVIPTSWMTSITAEMKTSDR